MHEKGRVDIYKGNMKVSRIYPAEKREMVSIVWQKEKTTNKGKTRVKRKFCEKIIKETNNSNQNDCC